MCVCVSPLFVTVIAHLCTVNGLNYLSERAEIVRIVRYYIRDVSFVFVEVPVKEANCYGRFPECHRFTFSRDKIFSMDTDIASLYTAL